MNTLCIPQSRLDKLYALIICKLASQTSLIVGIDGTGGAGKSTLAKRLAQEFDGSVVSLDDYLDSHMGSFIPHLDYSRLMNDIHNFTSHNITFLAIEGICLLAVLERVGINPDLLVYIKCLDQDGEWRDQTTCDENKDLNNIFEYLSKYETLPGIGDSDKELATYHNKYRPVAKADFVFSKIIGSGHDIF